jgi:Flp pilus assembly protein TadD
MFTGLHACAVVTHEPVSKPAPPSAPPQEQPFEPTSEPSLAPTATLVKKAKSERRAGRLELAAAHLERGLRIEPDNPRLWTALATIRLEQGNNLQAETMANKSNSLVRNDSGLQRKNWSIIARALRTKGDEQGARAAEKRALALEPI